MYLKIALTIKLLVEYARVFISISNVSSIAAFNP